jgi:hypothetical protein
MKNNLDLTIVIPINEINNDNDLSLLLNAIKSVYNQKNDFKPDTLLFVINSEVKNKLTNNLLYEDNDLLTQKVVNNINIKVILNDENSNNYQNQINLAVDNVKTKFFMILDSDDSISNFYLSNVNTYLNEMPKVDMFLTLIADIVSNNKIYRYINEINWAKDVTQDQHGFLSMQTLMSYNLISINGAIINTEFFKNIGNFKESIKLNFVHEFLLRFVHKNGIAYTIPKLGYLRLLGRENSYLVKLHKEMDDEEVEFWNKIPKQEYVWPHDRNKTYTKKDKKEETLI